MDLLRAVVMFLPGFHMNISIKAWKQIPTTILTMGAYYHEILLHEKNTLPFYHYRSIHMCELIVLDLIVSQEYAHQRGWLTNSGGGVLVDEKVYYDGCSHGRFAGLYLEMNEGSTFSVATLLQEHGEDKWQMKERNSELQNGANGGDDRLSVRRSGASLMESIRNPMAQDISVGVDDTRIATVSTSSEGAKQRRFPLQQQEHRQEQVKEKERKQLSNKLKMEYIRSMKFFEKEMEIVVRESEESVTSNTSSKIFRKNYT